jgi:hypothetical protein
LADSCLKKVSGFLLLLLVAFFFLTPLAAAADKTTDTAGGRPVRIAVIPFQALRPIEGLGSTVICPLCGAGYTGGKIEDGAERVIENIFIDRLKDFKDIDILPQEKVEAVYRRINAESFKRPLIEILKKVGTELKADILAVGFIFRYTERIGFDYGVERPASVAFEINFISMPKGETIWQGVFDKTQKSLSEDVFNVSSLKWLTVRELATRGMAATLKNFPGFQH